MKSALWKRIDYLKTFCKGDFDKLLLTIKPRVGIYNVYGRTVFRKSKGCPHYHKLVNANKKHNGWVTACNSLEKEVLEHFPNDIFYDDMFNKDVRQILKLHNFNTLKQFMIRLCRNNLYLNKNVNKWKKDGCDKCCACAKQTESHLHLFGTCKKTESIMQYMTRILKKAGYMENGNTIGLFPFKNLQS